MTIKQWIWDVLFSNKPYEDQWLVFPNLEDYTKEFEDIGPNAARKISGSQAKSVLEQSKLPSKAAGRATRCNNHSGDFRGHSFIPKKAVRFLVS